MSKPIAYRVTSKKPHTLVYNNSAGLKCAQYFTKGVCIMAADVISRLRGHKLAGATSKLEELEESKDIKIEEVTPENAKEMTKTEREAAKKKAGPKKSKAVAAPKDD